MLLKSIGCLSGQELEPLTYTNVPVGLDVLFIGYTYSEGGVLQDPSVPIEDAFIKTGATVLAYAHTFGLWGKSARIGPVLPYAHIDATGKLSGETRERIVSGFADPLARFQINLVGAPALTLQDFAQYKKDLIVGFSAVATAPWGQYDPDRLVNIGTNRWTFKPEFGVSKSLGKWTLEMTGLARYFAENDNLLGGNSRKQEPIFASQSHATYYFNPSTWFSLNITHFAGGRTKVNDIRQNDSQSNWRYGVNFSFNLNRENAIQFYASTGLSTRFGDEFDIFGISY